MPNRLYDPNAYQRHQSLYQARDREGFQDPRLAALEHGAFAESNVRENPILGPPAQLLAIPGYAAAKKLGLVEDATPPSLGQMAEAYRGLGRGFSRNVNELLQAIGIR